MVKAILNLTYYIDSKHSYIQLQMQYYRSKDLALLNKLTRYLIKLKRYLKKKNRRIKFKSIFSSELLIKFFILISSLSNASLTNRKKLSLRHQSYLRSHLKRSTTHDFKQNLHKFRQVECRPMCGTNPRVYLDP
jgi:hypothetical protein